MKKNAISEFELERQDFKIKLKRGIGPATQSVPATDDLPPLPGNVALMPGQMGVGPGATTVNDLEIKSPMIGTFYRAPSPEAGNYVEVGMEVNPESVVCIIEAMKVMNEIKAEMRGVITQVLVE